MRCEAFLFCIIIFISFIHAECSDGQVNINSASLSDLDKLDSIGPVKAQAIIDTRPFSSVDDLNKVKGIGDVTLQKIKTQGLACVDAEDETIETGNENDIHIEKDEKTEDENKNEQMDENIEAVTITSNAIQEPEIESIINLNSEEIVEDEIVYESKNGLIKHYAVYVFILFLVVVLLILLIKR